LRLEGEVAYELARAKYYHDGLLGFDYDNYLNLHPTVFHYMGRMYARRDQILRISDNRKINPLTSPEEHLYAVKSLADMLNAYANVVAMGQLTKLDRDVIQKQMKNLKEAVPEVLQLTHGRYGYDVLRNVKGDRKKGL